MSLKNLEPETVAKFYEPIPLIDKYVDEVREVSVFEGLISISNNLLLFYHKFFGDNNVPPIGQPESEFVNKNAMNDLLIKLESLYDDIFNDVNLKL